ncbi:membrane protein [Planctomycetota bacterium]|nr:membrane protein [Planctomycetota bacterium]
MATSVYCLATTEAQTKRIVDRLREASFESDDVSVLFPDQGTSRDFAHEKNTKAPEGTAVGVSAGGLVGGTLGWLIGIGSLAIPGVGPFIAAGPILAALSGAAVGAAVGGISGALIGMGMPEYEAKRYEGKIHQGRILISVHSTNGDQIATVKRIFTDEGAEDIASSSEASVPSDSKNVGPNATRAPARAAKASNTSDHATTIIAP